MARPYVFVERDWVQERCRMSEVTQVAGIRTSVRQPVKDWSSLIAFHHSESDGYFCRMGFRHFVGLYLQHRTYQFAFVVTDRRDLTPAGRHRVLAHARWSGSG
jgi:hypothetical protein